MSKEQFEEQAIIEMADDIRRIRESYFGQADYLFAKKMFEDGYRKQSAWISVGERLPEECTHVIVHDEDGNVGEAVYSKGGYFEWVENERIAFPTHWMPLPEPPMMKGGEQP